MPCSGITLVCKAACSRSILFFSPLWKYYKVNRPKRQPCHRSASRQKVQKESRLKNLDGHQEGQSNPWQHRDYAKNQKQTRGVHQLHKITYGVEGVFWCSCGALAYNQHATKCCALAWSLEEIWRHTNLPSNAHNVDGIVRFWDADYHMPIDYRCSRLLRDFTNKERVQLKIIDNRPTFPQP